MKITRKAEFLGRLAALPDAMKQEVRKAIVTSAEEMVSLAKRFAPDDPSTGAPDLKSSITYRLNGSFDESDVSSVANARAAKFEDGLLAVVSAGDEHTLVTNGEGGRFQNARLQEFGTKGGQMPAHPFFYPAYRLTKKRYRSRVQRAVNKGARKAFGK